MKRKITDDDVILIFGLLELKSTHKLHYSVRSIRSTNNTEFLNKIYTLTSYPNKELLECLSLLTKLSTRNIQIWFQNKRRKMQESRRKKKSNGTVDKKILIEYYLEIYEGIK